MKNKKILTITTIAILCTTGIAFANEIKILQKNNTDYIPFKQLVKKVGGNIQEKDLATKANIDGKSITIEQNSSFAKVDDNYYALNEKDLDGFKVPVDIKPLYEDKEMYVSKDFLKETKVVDFKVKDGKIILENENKSEDKNKLEKPIENIQNNKENETKENNKVENTEKPQQPEKPVTPTKPNKPNKPSKPSKPTKPDNGENNNSSNNGSNNNNNENNNNNGSTPETGEDNNNGSTPETGGDNNNENNNQETKPEITTPEISQ